MVVKQPELIERGLQCCAAGNRKLPQERFQRPKQTLDAPVLPGCTGIDTLMRNPGQPQKRSKGEARKDRLVVRA